MDNHELIVDEANNKFRFDIDGETAFIDFKMKGDQIYYLNHTEVPKPLEGKGIAGKLTSEVLSYIRQQGGTFVPRCSYISAFVKRHQEYNDILADRDRS